jgi:hypothetical protein
LTFETNFLEFRKYFVAVFVHFSRGGGWGGEEQPNKKLQFEKNTQSLSFSNFF